jgi:hypothetical protein
MSFFLRWLFAFLLLAATYNPTVWNYVRAAQAHWSDAPSIITLAGIILFIGYVIYLRATVRSIGAFGMLLVLALVGAILWVLWDFNVIDLSDPGFATWVAIFALSVVLGVGLSWSIIRRKLSGQVDMDDVEET